MANAESSSLTLKGALLKTSIFPERDNSCYLLVQKNSDDGTLCKVPHNYKVGKQLAGLMTLKNLVEGGHDVVEGKVLVCVKSIGGKRKGRSCVTGITPLLLMKGQSNQREATKWRRSTSKSLTILPKQLLPYGVASLTRRALGKHLTQSCC